MQPFHSLSAAFFTLKPRLPRREEARLIAQRFAAKRATIETRHPAAELNRPEAEVAQRNDPVGRAFDLSRHKQNQAKHRLSNFVLGQNELGDLADDGEAGTEAVVALRLIER